MRAKGLASQPRCRRPWDVFFSAAVLAAPAPSPSRPWRPGRLPCRLAVPWLLIRVCRGRTQPVGVAGGPCKVAWASLSEPGTRRCTAGEGSRLLKSLPTCLLSDKAGVLREMAGSRGSPPLDPLPSLASVPWLFSVRSRALRRRALSTHADVLLRVALRALVGHRAFLLRRRGSSGIFRAACAPQSLPGGQALVSGRPWKPASWTLHSGSTPLGHRGCSRGRVSTGLCRQQVLGAGWAGGWSTPVRRAQGL